MKAIVAVYEDWGIGRNGKMMHNIPEDMKFFRSKTLGRTVVMGRKTLESFPGQTPLKNRINIVLSKNKHYKKQDAMVFNTIEDAMLEMKKHKEVYIIGGAMIYEQFLPYCKEAYVTKINHDYSANEFFPNLDEDGDWELIEESDIHEYNGIEYIFTKYINKKVEVK